MQIFIKSVDMKSINIKVPTFLIKLFVHFLFVIIKYINKSNIVKDKKLKDLIKSLDYDSMKYIIKGIKYLNDYHKDLVIVDIKSKNGESIIIKV